ncbi:hypothetical protein D9611_003801 [Ephemerocybe angulata]|uniref:non-specific serine/threonine protein kinase n=1 Tax=Ephemerocybe angulata TaxID=980116 RepID=A0A8H5B6P6_9AGAR|nr:hypothetical protein D9611_003801 [Tulosesus angulatus]
MELTAVPNLDFFYPHPGMKFKNGRYELLRRLGSGAYSTTWLVYDEMAEDFCRYAAVKNLTRAATDEQKSGTMNELAFLKAIAAIAPDSSLPVLLDDFEIVGPTGPHLCFVVTLMGLDVISFRRSAPNKALRPYIVKKIISDVVESLSVLHESGIIHTDVQGNNVLFGGVDPDEIKEELENHPPEVIGQFELSDGTKHYVFAARPFIGPARWNMSHLKSEAQAYRLIDLGHAQWAGQQPTVTTFGSAALRAPEIVIGSDFGPHIDIWAVGCLTYELLAGESLFNPVGKDDREMEVELLSQIFALTGERYSELILSRAQWSDDFLDKEGNLKGGNVLNPTSVEARLSSRGFISEAEVKLAADFIGQCLKVEPANRPSAEDLLGHTWLYGAWCCNPDH